MKLTFNGLQDVPLSELKEMCLDVLKSTPKAKIKFICEGNKSEDFDKLNISTANDKTIGKLMST